MQERQYTMFPIFLYPRKSSQTEQATDDEKTYNMMPISHIFFLILLLVITAAILFGLEFIEKQRLDITTTGTQNNTTIGTQFVFPMTTPTTFGPTTTPLFPLS